MVSLLTVVIECYTVTVKAKAREIDVKGPKGSLSRSFKHIAIDITESDDKKSLKVDMWFGNRETIAAIRYVEITTRINFYLHTD